MNSTIKFYLGLILTCPFFIGIIVLFVNVVLPFLSHHHTLNKIFWYSSSILIAFGLAGIGIKMTESAMLDEHHRILDEEYEEECL